MHGRKLSPHIARAFKPEAVGWAMKAERKARLVTGALVIAIWRRGKLEGLLHHSNQGRRYTNEQFRRLRAEPGSFERHPLFDAPVRHRSGQYCDGLQWTAMESCFSSHETERAAQKVCKDES